MQKYFDHGKSHNLNLFGVLHYRTLNILMHYIHVNTFFVRMICSTLVVLSKIMLLSMTVGAMETSARMVATSLVVIITIQV